MDSLEFAQLLARAEHLSPERYPEQAAALNQRIVQLNPSNVAAYLRLARALQTQRQFAAATAACQDALQRNPQSAVAQRRLQRITEEWALAQQAQAIATYDEALKRGIATKEQDRLGEALASLWRAVELSSSPGQTIRCYNKLAAIYRSRKDLASLDRAALLYEWVLCQAPGNLTARRGLAVVLRNQQARQQEGEREQRRQRQRAQRKHSQQHKQAGQQRKSSSPTRKKPETLEEALKILNLKPPATRAAIKRAYRTQAQVAHPDHGGSHTAMVRLNAAYALALASAR